MKTIHLQNETLQAISTFLDESLSQEVEVMAMLSRVCGPESREFKAEAARYKRMAEAREELCKGISD